MDREIFAIVVGIIVMLAGIAIMYIVEAQGMTDEERKRLGLGPKGQGRK